MQTTAPQPPRRGWLFFEFLAELRAIIRMFVDPRYRLSWGCRLASLVLFLLIVFSWLLPLAGLSYFIDKAYVLVLSFFLFKVLGQEARRYRETAPDLPPSLRL
jgi:hypothetical protein